MLIKKLYKITSQRLSTRLHETIQIMRSALDTVQRAGSEVQGDAVGASALRERKCVGAERARAAAPADRLLAWVLGDLLSRKWPASFVNCLKERMCVDAVLVFVRGVRMVFVESELIFGEQYFSVDG